MAMRVAAAAAAAAAVAEPRGLRRLFSISSFIPPPTTAAAAAASPPAEPSTNLFVSGLSKRTTTEKLYEAFSQFGQVVHARVVTDRVSGYSKGFGFVKYATIEEAGAGIQGMDGKLRRWRCSALLLVLACSCGKVSPGNALLALLEESLNGLTWSSSARLRI